MIIVAELSYYNNTYHINIFLVLRCLAPFIVKEHYSQMISMMTRVLVFLILGSHIICHCLNQTTARKIYTNEKQKHCRKVKLEVYENKKKMKNIRI